MSDTVLEGALSEGDADCPLTTSDQIELERNPAYGYLRLSQHA